MERKTADDASHVCGMTSVLYRTLALCVDLQRAWSGAVTDAMFCSVRDWIPLACAEPLRFMQEERAWGISFLVKGLREARK